MPHPSHVFAFIKYFLITFVGLFFYGNFRGLILLKF